MVVLLGNPSGEDGVNAAPNDLVAELGGMVRRTLSPLLDRPGPIALVDYPDYDNIGDSALWLGAMTCLGEIGALDRVAYTCTRTDYVHSTLSRRLGRNGTLVISGGGNLGDVWDVHQVFREHLVEAFPHNPIIQLPQSIHFQDPSRLKQAQAVFERHPDITLLVRDEPSRVLAAGAFPQARVLACPDTAFCLGSLERPAAPEIDTLWLLRGDKESAWTDDERARRSTLDSGDWPRSKRGDPLVRRHRRLRRQAKLLPGLYPLLAKPLLEAGQRLATARVANGAARLARGARVVTDRLHGHILCELLGIPHAMIDNTYGKLSRHHAAWTSGSPLATMCATLDDALLWVARGRTAPRGPTETHRMEETT